MYLLIALLACGGDDTTPTTDAPSEATTGNNTPDAAPNMPSGDQGGGQPQGQDGMGQSS